MSSEDAAGPSFGPQRGPHVRLLLAGVLLGLPRTVAAHGMMNHPPTRFPNGGPALAGLSPDGSVFWFNQGCSPGCAVASGDMCTRFGKGGMKACCANPIEPTLNSGDGGETGLSPRTFTDVSYRYNPWRAPGHAPLMDRWL